MGAGDLVILERVQWDWFVSCTVKSRNASDVYLARKSFALFRYICRRQRLYFPNLPWALRIESGVDPEHRHFHCLVGGLPSIGQNERFACMNRWEYLVGTKNPENPRGTCRVRLYDPQRGAADYLAQVLNTSEHKGWMEGHIRLSEAAVRYARQAACESSTGIYRTVPI
ncbi:MAG: hypothetical protein A2283_20975 [Lentisphaerae bacterium RIFOXYA12_FULL_48_11]|nr:MAG: hypothetical protein A2283_20975 [Lentisphaerae bacterium RIFOXYA12_FULL_48_11]